MKAVRTAFAYLKQSKHRLISAQIYTNDVDIMVSLDKCSLHQRQWMILHGRLWSCWHRDAEVQNRRRSQKGLMVKLNGAPVQYMYSSKASSATFASDRIGEARADMSSGAVEICAVGNATLDIMLISYVVERPSPFHLHWRWTTMLPGCSALAPPTKPKTKTYRLPPRMGSSSHMCTPQQGHGQNDSDP